MVKSRVATANAGAEPVAEGAGPWFTLADVARDTGVSKDSLRMWERRYGFPQPVRNALDERLYPAAQVERLNLVSKLLDAGHRAGAVVALPALQLRQLANQCGAAAMPQWSPPAPWWAWICDCDVVAMRAGMRAALRSLALDEAIETLLAPLAVAVGQGWLRGDLSIHQEHLFTETLQACLREAAADQAVKAVQAVQAVHASGLQAPRVLLTTLPREMHAVGLLMADCMLAQAGCERVMLGPNTPVADIAAAAQALRVDVLALSCSAHYAETELAAALRQLRQTLPERCAIWAGGGAPLLRSRRLPDQVHYIASSADVAQAVRDWRTRRSAAHPAQAGT